MNIQYDDFLGSSLRSWTKLVKVTAIIIMLSMTPAQAKSSQEIAQIAKQTTVQINSTGSNSPGGSGVIIAKKGNVYTVATVNHVVCDRIPRGDTISCRDGIDYTVRTHTGKVYPLTRIDRLQKSTKEPDLAIVTFESAENYSVATIGNSNKLQISSTIHASGFPAVFNKTGAERDFGFTTGAITANLQGNLYGYNLAYDALTKVGMSGGPVFDSEGRVIALHGLADTATGNQPQTGNPSDVLKSGWNAGIPIDMLLTRWSGTPDRVEQPSPNENPVANVNNPKESRDFYAKGIIQHSQRNYQGAIENYTLAIQQEPSLVNAYNNRAKAFQSIGEYQRAIDDYTQVIKLDESYAPAYLGRADARAELKDSQNAIADYTRAIEIDSTNPYSYNNRATLFYDQKNWDGAITDLEKAVSFFLAQGRNREYDVAIENLEKAKRIRSKQPNSNPPVSPSNTSAKNISFAFTSLYDYSSCLDDILLFYEGKLAQRDNQVVLIYDNLIKLHKAKSQCIDDVLASYGNQGLSQQEAYYLLNLANYRATNELDKQLYPPLGIRRRAAILLGFVYEIDQNNAEILQLVPQAAPNDNNVPSDSDFAL